jgi:Tol biopolymer transport system component
VEIDSQFADGVSISRDGRLLAFSSTGRVVVCELPACGNRRELETRTTLGGGLQFTPDGTALAFIDGPTGANVWVQPLQGGEARQLTQFTDGRRLLGFAWSSDGRRLAMSRSSANSDIVLFSGLTGGAPE